MTTHTAGKIIALIVLIAAMIFISFRIGHADYALQGTPGNSQVKYCWQNCEPLELQASPLQLQPATNVLAND